MKPGKILIVEDERIARENLDFILQKWGYETLAVENGTQAFQELEKQEFDLVLTDLRLGQVDGMQVLDRTKKLYPDSEVIVITAFATVFTAVEAMQKGAYHYLSKPYKIAEVRVLVRQALEKRWLRQEVADLKRQMQIRDFHTLEENEKEYIAWVLQEVGGSRTKAAEILGIDRTSLWRKLKRYDLNGES
jgi:DNA-binding NtrC family response regulator